MQQAMHTISRYLRRLIAMRRMHAAMRQLHVRTQYVTDVPITGASCIRPPRTVQELRERHRDQPTYNRLELQWIKDEATAQARAMVHKAGRRIWSAWIRHRYRTRGIRIPIAAWMYHPWLGQRHGDPWLGRRAQSDLARDGSGSQATHDRAMEAALAAAVTTMKERARSWERIYNAPGWAAASDADFIHNHHRSNDMAGAQGKGAGSTGPNKAGDDNGQCLSDAMRRGRCATNPVQTHLSAPAPEPSKGSTTESTESPHSTPKSRRGARGGKAVKRHTRDSPPDPPAAPARNRRRAGNAPDACRRLSPSFVSPIRSHSIKVDKGGGGGIGWAPYHRERRASLMAELTRQLVMARQLFSAKTPSDRQSFLGSFYFLGQFALPSSAPQGSSQALTHVGTSLCSDKQV